VCLKNILYATMLLCNNWEHLLQCPNSSRYVQPYDVYGINDNWYKTKQDFEFHTKPFALSDERKVILFELCLYDCAKIEYRKVLDAYKGQVSYAQLIAKLDEAFLFYKPFTVYNFMQLSQTLKESPRDFICRVIEAGRDLASIPEEIQNHLITETVVAGLADEVLREQIVYELYRLELKAPVYETIQLLLDMCRKYEFVTSTNASGTVRQHSSICALCEAMLCIWVSDPVAPSPLSVLYPEQVCEHVDVSSSDKLAQLAVVQPESCEVSKVSEPQLERCNVEVVNSYVEPQTLVQSNIMVDKTLSLDRVFHCVDQLPSTVDSSQPSIVCSVGTLEVCHAQSKSIKPVTQVTQTAYISQNVGSILSKGKVSFTDKNGSVDDRSHMSIMWLSFHSDQVSQALLLATEAFHGYIMRAQEFSLVLASVASILTGFVKILCNFMMNAIVICVTRYHPSQLSEIVG